MLHSRHGIGFWGWETVSFKKKKEKRAEQQRFRTFLTSLHVTGWYQKPDLLFLQFPCNKTEIFKSRYLLCTDFTRKKCQITRWTLQIHSENQLNLWPRLTKKTHSVVSLHDCYDSKTCWHVQLRKITLSEVWTMHGYGFLSKLQRWNAFPLCFTRNPSRLLTWLSELVRHWHSHGHQGTHGKNKKSFTTRRKPPERSWNTRNDQLSLFFNDSYVGVSFLFQKYI